MTPQAAPGHRARRRGVVRGRASAICSGSPIGRSKARRMRMTWCRTRGSVGSAPTATRCATRPRFSPRPRSASRSTSCQSARARRETSIEPWHPEPVDAQADPALGAERREALELAVRMLLEKLSPTERAAYVLREAFDYPYRQISDVLAMSEANARQLVTRARLHLAGERRRQASAAEQQRFIDAFVDAAQTGDLTTLEQLLAAQCRHELPGRHRGIALASHGST